MIAICDLKGTTASNAGQIYSELIPCRHRLAGTDIDPFIVGPRLVERLMGDSSAMRGHAGSLSSYVTIPRFALASHMVPLGQTPVWHTHGNL